jgi:hypothetical protein
MAETLPALPVDLSDLAARAAEFARSSRSAATERAYRSDWADFSDRCGRAGLSPLPASPATVGAYLAARAGELKVCDLAQSRRRCVRGRGGLCSGGGLIALLAGAGAPRWRCLHGEVGVAVGRVGWETEPQR